MATKKKRQINLALQGGGRGNNTASGLMLRCQQLGGVAHLVT